MVGFFNIISLFFSHFIFFLIGQKTDQWLFMGSPWPMTLILISYLAFVLKIGPEFMKDRKPFQLKLILLVYNLLQTVISTYIVLQVSIVEYIILLIQLSMCDTENVMSHIIF